MFASAHMLLIFYLLLSFHKMCNPGVSWVLLISRNQMRFINLFIPSSVKALIPL